MSYRSLLLYNPLLFNPLLGSINWSTKETRFVDTTCRQETIVKISLLNTICEVIGPELTGCKIASYCVQAHRNSAGLWGICLCICPHSVMQLHWNLIFLQHGEKKNTCTIKRYIYKNWIFLKPGARYENVWLNKIEGGEWQTTEWGLYCTVCDKK